ncbi:hypothetical protein [Methanobacterium virus PhiF1]|nr:hypothetical protein [Methanobacterium virus PhiF1]
MTTSARFIAGFITPSTYTSFPHRAWSISFTRSSYTSSYLIIITYNISLMYSSPICANAYVMISYLSYGSTVAPLTYSIISSMGMWISPSTFSPLNILAHLLIVSSMNPIFSPHSIIGTHSI